MTSPAFSKTSIDSGMRAYDMHSVCGCDKCIEGTWFRSVTSCLKAVNKPPLLNWAGKVNREAIYSALLDADGRISIGDLRAATDKPHHNIASKGAADVGTLVHAYAESVFSNIKPTPIVPLDFPVKAAAEYAKAIRGFENWRKEHRIEVLWTERTLWLHPGEFHPTLGVCGTFDCALVVDGERLFVDIKTSADVYPEHWLQVACGLEAVARRDPMGAPDRLAILTVGKDGTTKLTTRDIGADLLEPMRACMTLANYLYGEASA